MICTHSTCWRFQIGSRNGVGEAEEEQVLHGGLAEVVVDAEDRRLVEILEDRLVEGHRGGEIAAEGLFDDHAGTAGAVGVAELLGDFAEEDWRDGEIVGRVLGIAESLPQRGERGGVVVVAVDVTEQALSLAKAASSMPPCFSMLSRARRFQLVEVPTVLGDADDGAVEVAALDHGLQRGEDLFVGEIAGGAEEDEGVGSEVGHKFKSLVWNVVMFWTALTPALSQREREEASPSFRDVRRSQVAWRRGACLGSRPRRGS